MKVKGLVIVATLVALGGLSGCLENEDQELCNELAGNGWYSPKEMDGDIYCFSEIKGDMFYLRPGD